MPYSFLADLLVTIHVGYVAFVVVGQLAILVGLIWHWAWVRNFWFRLTHMLAIGIVAAEALCQIRCPITVWEDQLRLLAGQACGEGSFMGRLMHQLLYYNLPDWYFDVLHVAFGVLVLATFVLAPPRWPEWKGWGRFSTGRKSVG